MEAATTDPNAASLILATSAVLVAIVGSTLTIITLMFRQFNRHEDSIKSVNTNVASLDSRVGVLETKVDVLDTKVTRMEGKFDDKLDSMGRDVSDTRERVARIEGHLMAPEGFTLRTPQPPDAADPPPDNPGPDPDDQRQAG